MDHWRVIGSPTVTFVLLALKKMLGADGGVAGDGADCGGVVGPLPDDCPLLADEVNE